MACSKDAQKDSVYCSEQCIVRHAEDSLRALQRQQQLRFGKAVRKMRKEEALQDADPRYCRGGGRDEGVRTTFSRSDPGLATQILQKVDWVGGGRCLDDSSVVDPRLAFCEAEAMHVVSDRHPPPPGNKFSRFLLVIEFVHLVCLFTGFRSVRTRAYPTHIPDPVLLPA